MLVYHCVLVINTFQFLFCVGFWIFCLVFLFFFLFSRNVAKKSFMQHSDDLSSRCHTFLKPFCIQIPRHNLSTPLRMDKWTYLCYYYLICEPRAQVSQKYLPSNTVLSVHAIGFTQSERKPNAPSRPTSLKQEE